MPDSNRLLANIEKGAAKAAAVIEQRKSAAVQRAAALQSKTNKMHVEIRAAGGTSAAETGFGAAVPSISASFDTSGFLVAAGDSWFDYPFWDVLKKLHDEHGYNVESSAHRGDPIEAMAYQGGQLDKFSRCLEKLKSLGVKPKAVLISGGGDDIAGNEFGMLINNAYSPIAGWNMDVVRGVINDRVLEAYQVMISALTKLCEESVGVVLPIFIHGYDYPVPDGRGFLGGWGPLPGPWLEPGFREKNYSALSDTTNMMVIIIDLFNQMLSGIPAIPNFAHVHYIDLRHTLSNVLAGDAYKDSWGNELHPTEKGFSIIAAKFAVEIDPLPFP